MPTWSGILKEIREAQTQNPFSGFDVVRRKYLLQLSKHTRRSVILYATGWLQKPDASASDTVIQDEDMQALMEVSYGLDANSKLDLILHSPGGSAEAAEAIVSYLRSRFPDDIRVIVPHLAMSAATMIACASNQIILGKHSSLGPIDPQLISQTEAGTRVVAAQAIVDQFYRAQEECNDPEKRLAWEILLSQYEPGLLTQCESALEMSEEMVEAWLGAFMFENNFGKAKEVAGWLADHKNFKSHARHISRAKLEEKGLAIVHLESDPELQDLVLSAFHATMQTFAGTSSLKIVTSHLGRAYVKHHMPEAQELGYAE